MRILISICLLVGFFLSLFLLYKYEWAMKYTGLIIQCISFVLILSVGVFIIFNGIWNIAGIIVN